MLGIVKLRNSIQPYAWGSRTAIAALRGKPPAPTPEAELWMGAHPKAPSEVELEDGWCTLPALIAARPQEVLGTQATVDADLPFLFKVLAADQPLSIQAHPDRQQAAAGFTREEAAGIPRDGPTRNYRDPHPKPEILCALTPFWVMRGFRAPAVIHRRLSERGLLAYLPAAEALRTGPEPAALRAFFASLLGLGASQRAPLIEAAVRAAASYAETDPADAWIPRLAAACRGHAGSDADVQDADVGILAPHFLNVFALAPGEALFTGPGVLHAYLEGVGIELMANSDNVLRGGLTPKHVDREELLAILRYESTAPTRLHPTVVGEGVEHFHAPQDSLCLSRLRVVPAQPYASPVARGAELLLVTEGAGRITTQGQEIPFSHGDSFLVPAAVPAYDIDGTATVFRAAG